MAFIYDTSRRVPNGCRQVTPVPRIYSQQSAYEHENASSLQQKKCNSKRQAPTVENNVVKIPRISATQLSPHMHHSPEDPCFISNTSNTAHSDPTTSLEHNGMLHTQESQMEVCDEVVMEHVHSGNYTETQLNKLGAQKIAIGI